MPGSDECLLGDGVNLEHKIVLAIAIAFARNLIEHVRGDSDPEFITLSLLHWKSDTAGIKQCDLDGIFVNLFGGSGGFGNNDEPVADMILRGKMNGGVNDKNDWLQTVHSFAGIDDMKVTLLTG